MVPTGTCHCQQSSFSFQRVDGLLYKVFDRHHEIEIYRNLKMCQKTFLQ